MPRRRSGLTRALVVLRPATRAAPPVPGLHGLFQAQTRLSPLPGVRALPIGHLTGPRRPDDPEPRGSTNCTTAPALEALQVMDTSWPQPSAAGESYLKSVVLSSSNAFVRWVKRSHPGALRDILATNLRRLRREKGYSQEAFGDLCGLDRTYIGSIERGERNVSIDNLERIARALNLEPWKLIRRFDDGH